MRKRFVSSRRAGLVAGLLLLPLLARADALDGAVMMLEILAALYGLALVTVVVVVLAYRKPGQRGLQVAQAVLLLLCLLLGLLWEQVFNSPTSLSGFLNPFLLGCLPVGAWLNGLTLARRAQHDNARLGWLAVAIIGLSSLLALFTSVLRLAPDIFYAMLAMGLQWIFFLGTSLAGWWLVLGQAESSPQLSAAVRRDWWRLPAVAAGVGVAYELVVMLLPTLWPATYDGRSYRLSWSSLLVSMLTTGGIIWAVGVLALRLKRPPLAVLSPEVEGMQE